MKNVKNLPYSKLAPELDKIAFYHGLQLNRLSEYKIALIIFSNLYYNAPWESENKLNNYTLHDEKQHINNTGLYLANRYDTNCTKFLQKFKGGWLRCLFAKRKTS